MPPLPLLAVCSVVAITACTTFADDITVRDASGLKAALSALKAGTTLKIAPGEYPGGHYVASLENLTIEALDPLNPPHFKGGAEGWHFSRCAGLTFRNVRISGQTGNGLNLDDGAGQLHPVTGITIDHVDVSDIGSKGNHDGVKCSGLDGLTIRDCTLTGWGGQGIDFVGCHKSLVTGCRFEGRPGFTASAGVQMKGGSSEITVEKCRFIHAGERPINAGGSTGLPYFRPPGVLYEAKDLVIRDNVIEGSSCSAAFVGVDGAELTRNTLLFPEKWIFRILQETKEPGFVPCRNVVIRDNRIVFRRGQVQIEVNSSDGTQPKSFQFEKNRWFAEDCPAASKPRLPSEEKDGEYGRAPRS